MAGFALKPITAGVALALSVPAMATQQAIATNLPSGGTIVAGNGSITSDGRDMTIQQNTDKLIANWQDFSIGADNSVTFYQPSSSSVALNRVLGQNPSEILGNLNANGQVFLVNPNGVVIGEGASVRTGAFVASSLELSDEKFLGGDYRFSGNGAGIVNKGSIDGAVVALISPNVSNEGSIKGDTALAAGTDVFLDFNGDGLLSVEVKASAVETLVENRGLIRADGGLAILTARGASKALKGVVNNTGTVQAQTLENKNGRILLLGDMDNGEATIAGTLDASAPDGGDGGFIETSAAEVSIDDSATITTAAGDGETGTWLIDPKDFTVAASGGDITGAALSSQLADNNVEIQSVNGAAEGMGDIFVDDTITWDQNTLTLNAERNIEINSELFGSGTAGLTLKYNQADAGGDYFVNAPVNLASTGSFQTKDGSAALRDYVIITELGRQGSTTGTDLQGINLTGDYVLGTDIDSSSTSGWAGGAGFSPIGEDTGPSTSTFRGTFDGLGHEISNLVINRPAMDGVGLFGATTNGSIRHVGLENASISGNSMVGALVGMSTFTTISDSYASGRVRGSLRVGGLVGQTSGTISRSHATADVGKADASTVGGLVGYNTRGNIIDSWAGGDVTGKYNLGGLAGSTSGAGSTIEQSYALGRVEGDYNLGGLVGSSQWEAVVTRSYAMGAVVSMTGGYNIGGLVGSNDGGAISQSYATGAVTGADYNMGGLVGGNQSRSSSYQGSVTDSYWNRNTSGQTVGVGDNGDGGTTSNVVGLTTAQMRDPFTFINGGWDFGATWSKSSQNEHNGYMMLRWQDASLYGDFVRLSGDTVRQYGDRTPPATAISVGSGNVSLDWGSAATNVGTYAYTAANVLDVTTTSAGGVFVDYGSGRLTINPASLTIGIDDVVKTYDGTTTAAGVARVIGGQLFGDDSLSGGNFAFTDKNAGNGKTVTVSGVAVLDGNGGNNYVVTYANNNTSTIEQAELLLTGILADDKVYDGTTLANLNTDGLGYEVIAGDDVQVGSNITGAFEDKNAGENKQVLLSATLSGADAGNYRIGGLSATTANIAAKTITGTIDADNKVYDGTADAVTQGNLSGIIAGDEVNFITGGSFADKHAGDNKTVSLTSELTGADAGNYQLVNVGETTTANITPAALVVTVGDITKIYDGTTGAEEGVLVHEGQLFDDDSLSGGTFAFADKNAGTGKRVRVSGVTLADGNDGNNYAVTYVDNTNSTIEKADLTLSAVSDSKVYDGTAVSGGEVAVNGLVAGDSLSNLSQSFASKNVLGTDGSTLNVSGGYLLDDGNGGNNYTVTLEGATGTITPASLTITAGDISKTYDGTTAANGTAIVDAGTLFGDDSLGGGSFAFADKNAGSGKTVSVSGVTIADGNGGDNYDVTYVTNINSSIDKAQLTFTGVTAEDKVYDGTTDVALNLDALDYSVFGDDEVNLESGLSGQFADKNAGADKTVVLDAILGGADAGNYELGEYSDLIASIVRREISGSITTGDKVYDGTVAATTSGSLDGVIAGDDVDFGTSGSFADRHAGTGKTVTLEGSLDGVDAANYTLVHNDTALADITPASLSVTVGDITRTYDGTTAANGTAIVGAGTLFGSDSLSGGSFAFADENAGSGKTVSVSNAVIADGNGGNNYDVTYVANTNSTIDQAQLTFTGVTAEDKVYDGATDAMLNLDGLDYTVFGDDEVSLESGLSGQFADKNAGENKTVELIAALGGADAGNYRLGEYADLTASIARREITGSITADNKVYDGTAAAATSGSLDGVIAGDTIDFDTSGSFADRHVGENKTITLDYDFSGADAANYNLIDVNDSTIASITPATLLLSAVSDIKVHDETTISDGVVVANGLVEGDSLDNLSQSFDSADVGNRTLLVDEDYELSDGNDGNNYAVVLESADGQILPMAADSDAGGILSQSTRNSIPTDSTSADPWTPPTNLLSFGPDVVNYEDPEQELEKED